MAREWSVTTEQVKNSATKIEDFADQFATEYEKLYTELTALRSSKWQGVASDQFNTKLEGYRQTLEDAKTLLVNYAEFLNKAATNYENTESDIESAAASLTSGN